MANDVSLPNMQEPVFPGGKPPTHAYRKFFERLSRVAAGDTGLQAQIAELAAQVATLEESGGHLAKIFGDGGITVFGAITDPVVRIRLTAYLSDLVDVSDALPANGDRLTWDATLALWKAAPDTDPTVPYFIPSGETYSVAANKQAIFTMPIDVEGFLNVEGYLVGVG